MVNSLRPIILVDVVPIGMDLAVMHSVKDRQLVLILEIVPQQELVFVTRIIMEQAVPNIADQRIAFTDRAMKQDFVRVMPIILVQIAVFFVL